MGNKNIGAILSNVRTRSYLRTGSIFYQYVSLSLDSANYHVTYGC